MKRFTTHLRRITATLSFLFVVGVSIAQAHEVYVLDGNEVAAAKKEPMLDVIGIISNHPWQFMLWVALACAVLSIVFVTSVNRKLERKLDSFYDVLKAHALSVSQAVLGASLLAGAAYGAIFGIELPFSVAFTGFESIATIGIALIGAMLVVGIAPRYAAWAVVALFVWFSAQIGIYMLNYAAFFGIAVAIAVYGAGYDAVERAQPKRFFARSTRADAEVLETQFVWIRVSYGLSLAFASLYAKLFYGGLALATVEKYSLTDYLPFEPGFLVLGAMFVEVGLGIAIATGFMSRFATLAALIVLSITMWFFGESLWPHVIVMGGALSIFMYGYDKHCLSVAISGKSRWDPVL